MNSELNGLKQQLQDVRNNMEAFLQRDGMNKNHEGYVELQDEETRILSQIDAIESKEAIIVGSQDPDSSFTLTVADWTVDFRNEAKNEESYQALSVITQLKLQDLEQINQAEIRALKASYEADMRQLELQAANANAHNKVLEEENAELKNELIASNLAYRNSSAALEASQEEVEAYRKQVEELRTQVSKPTVTTNLDNGALADAMSKLKQSRRAIYNVVNDAGNINYTAQYVDNDEEFTDKLVYIGKYRIATDEEVLQFRQEREAAEQAAKEAMESIPDDSEVVHVTEEDFREQANIPVPELPITGNLLAETTSDDTGELAEAEGQTVEIVTSDMLERRIKQIKEEIKYEVTAELVMEYGLVRKVS